MASLVSDLFSEVTKPSVGGGFAQCIKEGRMNVFE